MTTSSLHADFSVPFTLGWDIGGAHLKIAVLDQSGHLIAVEQYPCALWRGLDQLTPLLTHILQKWAPVSQHALTMSGEMVDLFSDRVSGVRTLLQTFSEYVVATSVQVYGGNLGFLSLKDTQGQEAEIASANWLATAAWAAQHIKYGILLDIGSTTTDVLCFSDGRPVPHSIGDADRLITEELVYNGVTRTPLMALGQYVTWQGARRGVMAELFATTADVYRVLGSLPEEADQHTTADGGPKTRAASITRMARMIGLDGHEYEEAAWCELAEVWQVLQQAQILSALNRAKQRMLTSNNETISLVIAGVGRFLSSGLMHDEKNQTDFNPIEFSAIGSLIHPDHHNPRLADYASRCAPAVAVAALLLKRNLDHRSITA